MFFIETQVSDTGPLGHLFDSKTLYKIFNSSNTDFKIQTPILHF